MGYLSSINRSISSYLHTSLSLALYKNDRKNSLPRVFFCSIVWIHQSPLQRKEEDEDDTDKHTVLSTYCRHDDDDDHNKKNQSMKTLSKLTKKISCHNNNHKDTHVQQPNIDMNTTDVVDDDDECTTTIPQNNDFNDIKDHKFTIIKHSNENYQIVQGYITQNSMNKGYSNSDWQRMTDNKYSSCDGFNQDLMRIFLSTLGNYVDNKTVFSTRDHYNMFGMRLEESNGGDYWPSLSYSELVDSCIIGCGDRCVANAVEDYIDNYIDE